MVRVGQPSFRAFFMAMIVSLVSPERESATIAGRSPLAITVSVCSSSSDEGTAWLAQPVTAW